MPVDTLAWLAASVVLVIGGVLGLLIRRDHLGLTLVALATGLIGILVGEAWRAWRPGLGLAAFPGAAAADGLALLAGGALVVTAWMAFRWTKPAQDGASGRFVTLAIALLGAAALALAAAALAWRSPLPEATPHVRSWLFGLRGILWSVGLGGWLPVVVGSVWGQWSAGQRGTFPIAAADHGRVAALFSYPWLTAALLVTMVLDLAARAAILSPVPGVLWPWVAWLLGAAYLHATSSWRPRRVPAWLATVLAALALAAAVMGAISAW